MKSELQISHDKFYDKFFESKDELLEFLNDFSKNVDDDLWWTFEYEPESLRLRNQLLLLTNDFYKIIHHVKEKNIPPTFAENNSYSLYLTSFESRERAIEILKKWNEPDDD